EPVLVSRFAAGALDVLGVGRGEDHVVSHDVTMTSVVPPCQALKASVSARASVTLGDTERRRHRNDVIHAERTGRPRHPPRETWRGVADESACTPDSVPARLAATRWAAIHLGLPSPAGSSGLPAGIGRAILKRLRGPPQRPFLALLRVGFAEPPRSPEVLVGSYPTVSPLPAVRPAVCFLWHFPAGHPGLLLATTLPYGVRTFLGGGSPRRRGRPADSSATSM